MSQAGLLGGAGALQGLQQLLASRIAEEDRQRKIQQEQAVAQRQQQQQEIQNAAAQRAAESHPLNLQKMQQDLEPPQPQGMTPLQSVQMMKAEADLMPQPTDYQFDTVTGQRINKATGTADAIPGFTPRALPLPETLEHAEAMAEARARGARRGAPLRQPAGPQLGMPVEYYEWIRTLPSTDKGVETGIQKALRFAPQGSDPQRITQAVREAYGMTARPSVSEQRGVDPRLQAAYRARLDALRSTPEDELSEEELSAAIDALTNEYTKAINAR